MAPSRQRSILKAGRPPTARQTPTVLSQKATSSTIRTFHQLNKGLSAATASGDETVAAELRERIGDLGGLERYQKASIQGQATDRGGDSSIVLVEWLREFLSSKVAAGEGLKLLEVGALSTSNACSRASDLFTTIERIDLNSQSAGIKTQDFMERPLPTSEGDHFDVISLSLVLNFVPSPTGRGAMLRRTCRFLSTARHETENGFVRPALFLVLPAACTTNSRFLNDELLALIMASLGYVLRQRRQTAKLVYYLWILRDRPTPEFGRTFTKREINPGKARNNFCVVLEGESKG